MGIVFAAFGRFDKKYQISSTTTCFPHLVLDFSLSQTMLLYIGGIVIFSSPKVMLNVTHFVSLSIYLFI